MSGALIIRLSYNLNPMKPIYAIVLPILLLAITACGNADSAPAETAATPDSSREFYQLKTYVFDTEEQVQITDEYLQNSYLPALKAMGIANIGVFKQRPSESDSTLKTWVLIPFASLEQFDATEAAMGVQEASPAAGSAYATAAYDTPPYRRIESALLKAFTGMPNMEAPAWDGPKESRVYELRSYESATEAYYRKKVDMFNAGGEVPLFDRLEFHAVFYAEVISGGHMPNLMYMTTFPDMATRDAKWDAFRNDPAWLKLKEVEKYKHSVSHADIMLLYPTEYSDY